MAKENPYKNAALNMSKTVSDAAILDRIGQRKKGPPPPGHDEQHESPAEEAHESPGEEAAEQAAGPEEEGPLSPVDRLERSFGSKNKRSVTLGGKDRGQPGPVHKRQFPPKK